MIEPVDLPVFDLRAILQIGLERGRHLLSAGEVAVVDRIVALEGEPGRVFARLSARVPAAFECASLAIPGVDDLRAATTVLEQLELIDRLVPWPERASALTIPRLRAAAASLGLSKAGKKADLVARVGAHRHFVRGPWIRIRHKALIRRLERWAFLSRRADRSTLVVERLGLVIWPEYQPTSGPSVHLDRRSLHRWEALLGDTVDLQQALEALDKGHAQAAGRLDLSRSLSRAVADSAQVLESSDPAAATAIYQALADVGHPADPVRHARALELAGDPQAALTLLRSALDRLQGPTRLAVQRSGRRLARRQRTGWAPDPPLLQPKKRILRLPASGTSHRPLYRVAEASLPIERALVAHLAALGRRAIHGENGLWTTLFALAFADVYFLPVPGALPTRWLAGPLDLGSPGFYGRRREALDAILSDIRAGKGPDRIAAADIRWRGTRITGAHWELAPDDLLAVATGLGGDALADVLTILLQRGWRAARGLPDLAILPGEPVHIPHAVPVELGPGLLLAELKGPTDAVRDAQALWFHRLRSAGAPIALWEVRPLGTTRSA